MSNTLGTARLDAIIFVPRRYNLFGEGKTTQESRPGMQSGSQDDKDTASFGEVLCKRPVRGGKEAFN